MDTTFKYLYKRNPTWYNKIIFDLTGIDLSQYKLTDNELNTGSKKYNDYRLDILLKKNDDDYISIEMNREKGSVLIKNHKYAFRIASMESDKNYNKTYVTQINFNNWYCESLKDAHMATYILTDTEHNLTMDYIKIIEVYLPRCRDKWYTGDESMRYLAMFTAKNFEEMKNIVGEDKEAQKIMEELKGLSENELFKDFYDTELVQTRLMNGMKAEGIQEKQLEVAKIMLSKNFSIKDICECTGLSEKEIEKITI